MRTDDRLNLLFHQCQFTTNPVRFTPNQPPISPVSIHHKRNLFLISYSHNSISFFRVKKNEETLLGSLQVIYSSLSFISYTICANAYLSLLARNISNSYNTLSYATFKSLSSGHFSKAFSK